MRRVLKVIIIIAVAVTFFMPRPAVGEGPVSTASMSKIDHRVQARLNQLQAGEKTTVIVTLKQQFDPQRISGNDRAARQRNAIRALQDLASASQGPVRSALAAFKAQGRVGQFTSFWIFNGFSVTASPEIINALASRPEVQRITPDEVNLVPAAPLAYLPAEANLTLINAPALWDQGFFGQGITIASLDTGVSLEHPEIESRWRGGSNSWFDPYGQHPTAPTDLTGHGTQVMGIIVGADGNGSAIGVAPQAQWISAKIFNDQGSATATAVHQAFQWLLDPDGDPATTDAPQIVNNSWAFGSPGCNLEFQLDLQALLAANILPVFAAGNYGPYASKSVSPANYPEALAVGAINNNNLIYGYSSRGPSACGEASGIYPEIVAPGVNVKTTDLGGFYAQASGTSLAAPHVSGALALLLNAYPNLSVVQQREALINSAFDLGAVGPDNNYGYGRLNVLAAHQWLQSGGSTSTPTPLPTEMATPLPTATSTPLPTATSTPLPTATSTPAPTSTSTPLPTATSTPLPTATSTPLPPATPTAQPSTTLHVGDLDRSAMKSGMKWNATVSIMIHTASEAPLANATVSGRWSNGASGTASCVTNASGVCQVAKSGLGSSVASVKFSVTNVTRSSFTYTAAANHDPDGDSTGTAIVVFKP
jgi:subtilisin family serine protease